jgi:hypothetical protein
MRLTKNYLKLSQEKLIDLTILRIDIDMIDIIDI